MKRKKLHRCLGLVLSAVLAVGMLTGCSSGDKSGTAGNTDADSKEESSAQDTAAGDVVTIISAGNNPEEHFQSIAMDAFEEYVEEHSGGTMQVETYPNQQMGADGEVLEGTQLGNIQVGYANCSNVATVSDTLYILDHPFLFSNSEQAYKVLDGEVGDYMLASLEKAGLVGLGWLDNGFRELTCNVEVHAPSDLEGQKIRTMENPLQMAAWEMLGASPTPMAYSEVFTGLQQKTIDGQENPIGNIAAQKFYEVQDYCIFTDHIYSANPIFMNKAFYDGLTEEQQQIVREAAEYAEQVSREKRQEQDEEYLATIKENCTVIELTDEEKQGFKDAVAGMYDKVVEKAGQEIVDMMYEACGLK